MKLENERLCVEIADMGAEVIKIELPGKGDDSRANAPQIVNEEKGLKESAYYINLNRMPDGGSITFAMAPMVLLGVRHGPGWGALSGFVRKTAPEMKTYAVETCADVVALSAALKG